MYAYREIVEKKSDVLKITNLLNRLINQKIEVIILPLSKQNKTTRKSLLGTLSKYKNLDVVELENSAWEQAIKDKYGSN